jgi:hypothetical protein
VRVTNGGCSSKAQTDVPKNPEDYIWIFPSGCQTACMRDTNNVPSGYLIGPHFLHDWSWFFNDAVVTSGTNSFPDSFPVIDSGTYNLQIHTSENGCSLLSDPLVYNSIACSDCHIDEVLPNITVTSTTPFCSYTLSLEIHSSSTFQGVITALNNDGDPTNDFIIGNTSVLIESGTYTYHFSLIPIGNFTGGIVHLQISGTEEGSPCIYNFTVNVPSCTGAGITRLDAGVTSLPFSVVLAPNPAKDTVTVYYKGLPTDAQVAVYEVTGRSIATYPIVTTDGNVSIPTATYPKGIYIVVVRSGSGLLSQQKLIIE